jgi:gas vesicle protein
MMDDGYISELVKKFKESISQEESELVDRFKEYLQIAIMSIKNNESKFINKDDESIRSVVTKMANDLIYASLEKKREY